MGAKKVLPKFKLMNAVAMSGTATITSSVVDVTNIDNIGIRVKYVGTATGVISILASVYGDEYDALTFDPVLDQPAGASGSYLIDLNQFPFSYFKIQYVNASGSGALSAWVVGKDVN